MTMKTILAMFAAAGAVFVAFSQAPLAGQAGSDTVKRAQAPATVKSETQTPEAKPEEKAPEADPKDAVKIGVIEALNVTGNAVFIEEEQVADALKEKLCDGQEKTVGDLKRVLAEARADLIDRGYYLITVAPASANAYHAETKTLDLIVDPGRFGDVRVTMKNNEGKGDWFWDDQIYRRFKYVKKGEPFNYITFRQALRQLNGHPDLLAETKLNVRKPAEPKAGETNDVEVTDSALTRYVDAELAVEDTLPLHATLDINNYGMDELDNWQGILTLQYLNLTGADDALTVSPGMSFNAEMFSVAASYARPFDWLRGGSWSVYGGWSRMDCDEILDRLDLLGTGGFAGLNTSWNLWDTEKRNIAFNIGIQWRYIEDEWSVLSKDLQNRNLNILPLTVGFSYADKRRDWLGGLDYASIGESFELLGGEDRFREYSEDADPNYLVFRGSWARLQPFFGPDTDGEEWRCWSWFHKIEGQYSGQNLITAERLAYGGNSCLRGYRRRGYLGDSGIYGTGEIRTPFFCDSVASFFRDSAGKSPIDRIQFFVFTDLGYIAYNESYPNMEDDEFLWSAGFGCRAGLTQYMSLNLDVAFPLREAYADREDNDCEAYLSVRFQF